MWTSHFQSYLSYIENFYFLTCLWLWNVVRDSMSFHVPFQGWLWAHVEAMQPKMGFCLLPYEREQNFALSKQRKTNKKPQTRIHTNSPPTTPYNPGGFKIDLSSIILFIQLLSALKRVTFRFYHLKYHKFSSGICSFLLLSSLQSCGADILAFIASVQIVELL